MISWGDVYKVGAAMAPLYVPLLLGFWSVRRWHIFTPEQCEAVNRLVAFFAVPFFTFGFTINDDVEASAVDVVDEPSNTFVHLPPQFNDDEQANATTVVTAARPPSIWALVKVVLHKLGRNPNAYASVGGIIVASIANRLQMSLPIIIENSIAIMARCGNGLAMFSMGLFMAQQDNLIPCGAGLTFLGLVLKFVLGPIAMTIGSIAVGLRGDVVRVAIIQAAVPQSITSFIFAKEYGLHPDVLSTA
ncbi:hypothetical protein PR202_ga11625 [Eleusine coracana subsp. coracana]|uniref:Auxin efflux carrier component n=1 Tax=Eleusine coracana subsp. coracana TaxID=191504 RepID=A0AAV5C9H5_ELECO|nr:hypothetical protein PR202_ga11625 [Eleusine coracana subsp. coracana]